MKFNFSPSFIKIISFHKVLKLALMCHDKVATKEDGVEVLIMIVCFRFH